MTSGRKTKVFWIQRDVKWSVAPVKIESSIIDKKYCAEAQRFPVIITFDDDTTRGLRRLGGQADVLIYTSNNWVINPLGWMWIRVLSWLSYVY